MRYSTRQLIEDLDRVDISPADAATAVFTYIFGRVVREVGEYAEFGSAEATLQEVRYFLNDQGSIATLNNAYPAISNITLPIFEERNEADKSNLKPAADLYRAALLFWEYATEQYVDHRPWQLEENWRAACALLEPQKLTPDDNPENLYFPSFSAAEDPPEGSITRNNVDSKFVSWLGETRFYRFAYTAGWHLYHRLCSVSENDAAAELAHEVTHYISSTPTTFTAAVYNEVANNEIATLGASDALYLLTDAFKLTDNSLIQARLTVQRASIHRLTGRLRWVVTNDVSPEGRDLSAAQLYLRAIELLNAHWRSVEEYTEAERRTKEEGSVKVELARALNNYSYTLSTLGFYKLAETYCNYSIRLLKALYWAKVTEPGRAYDHDTATALGRGFSNLGEIIRRRAEQDAWESWMELLQHKPAPLGSLDYELSEERDEDAEEYREAYNRYGENIGEVKERFEEARTELRNAIKYEGQSLFPSRQIVWPMIVRQQSLFIEFSIIAQKARLAAQHEQPLTNRFDYRLSEEQTLIVRVILEKLKVARGYVDGPRELDGWRYIATVATALDDPNADYYYTRAIDSAIQLGDRFAAVQVLNDLTDMWRSKNDVEKAAQRYEEGKNKINAALLNYDQESAANTAITEKHQQEKLLNGFNEVGGAISRIKAGDYKEDELDKMVDDLQRGLRQVQVDQADDRARLEWWLTILSQLIISGVEVNGVRNYPLDKYLDQLFITTIGKDFNFIVVPDEQLLNAILLRRTENAMGVGLWNVLKETANPSANGNNQISSPGQSGLAILNPSKSLFKNWL